MPYAPAHAREGGCMQDPVLPGAALGRSAQKTVASWQLYFQQPVLPASLAFIMLHFNAVLSPGCLMTAFLSSRGLSGTAAAVFR